MAAPPREIYLADGFDATKLKIPQLRSILLEHEVRAPSTAKKADLVALFIAYIQPRAAQILAADARVRPSGHGIIAVSDSGIEAPIIAPLAEPSAGVKRARAKPKKSTTAVSEEVAADEEAVAAPPAKKPRSRRQTVETEDSDASAKKPRKTSKKPKDDIEIVVSTSSSSLQPPSAAPTPSRRKSSKLAPNVEPPTPSNPVPSAKASLAEYSHSDVPASVRKPRTSFKVPPKAEPQDSEEAAKRKPRLSYNDEDEGGFSDFNPFQAGSSDAAQAERRRRKSSLGLSDPTSKPRRAPRPSEWTASSAPTQSILRRTGPSSENLRSPASEEHNQYRQEVESANERNREVEKKIQDVAVTKKDESQLAPARRERRAIIRPKAKPANTASTTLSIGISLLVFLLSSYYKSMSAANGYCDAGSTTNDVIQGREIPIANAQACLNRRAEWQLDHPGERPPYDCDLTSLPAVPFFPRPTKCTPCPQYANCANGEVVSCAPEYILTPSLLEPLNPLFDGWPGVPSRIFTPTCRPDTARMRQVGQLARQVEVELAKGRGHVECAGVSGNDNLGVAERYGTLEKNIRESFAERRVSSISREQFDELFDAAIQDLVEHGDVIESIDIDGQSWYASTRSDMNLQCRAKLEAKHLLDQWKSQLSMTAAVLASIFLFKNHIEKSRENKKRAQELVDVVLKRLRDQERLHFTDPVSTPQPYLPPAQLRDIVLPASESSATRETLWRLVTEDIEKNANVAVGEREVRGDVWKTWEWTGVGNRIEAE